MKLRAGYFESLGANARLVSTALTLSTALLSCEAHGEKWGSAPGSWSSTPKSTEPDEAGGTSAPRTAPATSATAGASARTSATNEAPSADAGVGTDAHAVSLERAEKTLFGTSLPVEASRCKEASSETKARIECLLDVRYASDEEAKKLVRDLYGRFGIVVGQGEAETMDGAYRGHIRLAPTLPVGKDRKHLVWLHAAMTSIDTFVRALEAKAPGKRVTYRYKPLLVKFVRSLDGKHTPSGYASDWTYSYNVEGSLNTSAEAVANLAVHEIFHLNDLDSTGPAASPGSSRTWSERTIGSDVDAIVARCGTKIACLTPYTPTPLLVRGGTYYAFQPGNRITLEYAAELSTRVFDEQRGALGLGPKKPAFKCGKPENARSWKAMIDAYFGGIDLVPGC
jgi:hypothetical protein